MNMLEMDRFLSSLASRGVVVDSSVSKSVPATERRNIRDQCNGELEYAVVEAAKGDHSCSSRPNELVDAITKHLLSHRADSSGGAKAPQHLQSRTLI